ncbi:MAG: PIN domain-containing protein [Oscillospiraceae bacterium]|nr:PIN domain-containing protein [Oscillospiraceae bacterium]
MKYALDTNIVSYILKGDSDIIKKYHEENDKGAEFSIPPLVYYEINRGLFALNAAAKLKEFDKLCQQFGIGEMNHAIWDESVKIYAKLKNQGNIIEDADIFIAAYCIVNNYILITNNVNHFERIDNLNYINWK